MQTQGNGSSAVSKAQGEESHVVPRKKEEGSNAKQKQGYVSITPSYSRVSDKLRRISSGSLQCSLFCGGQRCKYENAVRWGEKDRALKGLFSHWVTDNILAMARPSTHIFEEFQLVEQFKTVGIWTVINLQLPWEHAKCGPGLERSGFTYQPEYLMRQGGRQPLSYQPEYLMRQGVYFYNYGWLDYGVPTLESILDMVKVVDFALRGGKVAIHCHAGLGRTGVLIACYLVYSQRMSGDEAITHVRSNRPGSIQTRPQIEIVQQFDVFLCPLWNFYPSQTSDSSSLSSTFEKYLHNQSLLLHGTEKRDLKYIPKVVYEVCSRMKDISKQGGKLVVCESCDSGPISLQHEGGATVHHNPNGFHNSCLLHTLFNSREHSSSLQTRVKAIQEEMNASLEWSLVSQETDLFVLFTLLSQYFTTLQEPLLSSGDVQLLQDSCTLDNLSQAKSSTMQLVLDTVREVFSDETLKLHGELLASELAQMFLQQVHKSSQDGATTGRQESGPPPSPQTSPVVSLILNHWRVTE